MLEMCEDIARMGEDALGPAWVEPDRPGDMPGDLSFTRRCCLECPEPRLGRHVAYEHTTPSNFCRGFNKPPALQKCNHWIKGKKLCCFSV